MFVSQRISNSYEIHCICQTPADFVFQKMQAMSLPLLFLLLIFFCFYPCSSLLNQPPIVWVAAVSSICFFLNCCCLKLIVDLSCLSAAPLWTLSQIISYILQSTFWKLWFCILFNVIFVLCSAYIQLLWHFLEKCHKSFTFECHIFFSYI